MADQQQPQQQEMNATSTDGGLNLPPGFHFHPSDNEIVIFYLMNKVRDKDFTSIAIAEVDLNKTEPWDLPRKAKMGEKEWYFFYQKDRKYQTGLRANRATEAGYWRATGKDKEVYDTTKGVVLLVGMKKTLVFYKGRAPRAEKTNWVMHEYRLEGSGRLPDSTSSSGSAVNAATMKASSSTSKDEWVVCRVFDKTKVAMASAEIDHNHNNIPAVPNPMPLQLPLSVPMPNQFPILPDSAIDPMDPYIILDAGTKMPHMMPPMSGIGGTGSLQIDDSLFSNPIAMTPQMNVYHQIGMGAAAGHMGMEAAVQMEIGAASTSNFDVDVPESRPSLIVPQKDEQPNAAEIWTMLSGWPRVRDHHQDG